MNSLVPARVSVITACFNDGWWLPETVESVRAQTHPDIEHIVIDDGSTDAHTLDVLAGLDGTDVRVIRLTHGGLPRARNAGLALATGEFVLPLDSDDLIEPTYCAKGVAALQAHPVSAIAVPDIQQFGDSDLLIQPLELDPGGVLHDPMMTAAMFVRRSAIDEVGGYDESVSYAEDDELWVRILARHPQRVHLREPLLLYRRRAGQMSEHGLERSHGARTQIFRKHAAIYAEHAPGFLGRIRAERLLLDHFQRRYGSPQGLGPIAALLGRDRSRQ